MGMHEILKAFLLPPLSIFVLGAILAAFGWRRLAWTMALLLLYAASLPLSASLLSAALAQPQAPLRIPPAPWVLVILGGGRLQDAVEYRGDGPSPATLQRLRYGAVLARAWPKVPVWVSGGRVDGEAQAEAELMQRSLAEDFALPRARLHAENISRNTAENARMLASYLGAGQRVLLVTDALHMPRALTAMRLAGLQPYAAPLAYYRPPRRWALRFLPQAEAGATVDYALWELVGRLQQGLSILFSSRSGYANLSWILHGDG